MNLSLDLWTDLLSASQKYADHCALVIEDTPYTYQELYTRVWAICSELRYIDSAVVGVMAENNIETYASLLALLFSGRTYVVLHPSYPTGRNAQIVSRSGMRCLLHSENCCIDGLRNAGLTCVCSSDLSSDLTDPFIPASDSELPAYLIFTSGSTGEPKGVPISRSNLNAFYKAYGQLGWQLDSTDRMLQMFELTFDVSIVSYLYPLTLGASIYTVPSTGLKYLNVLDIIERNNLTFAAVAPSILRLSKPYFSEMNFPSLRHLVVTAEASDVQLLESFRSCIPNARIVNLYGPTEATIYCTSYTVPTVDCKHHHGMVAIGKPFPGMTVRLMDEQECDVPVGEMGELWVSGPQVMEGYWHDTEKTQACMSRDESGKMYYHTGDLCRIDAEGDIYYCGRKDTQVKIQGFRIELGEIEYQVKQFYAGSTNAVVVARDEEDGNTVLHLVLETEAVDLEALELFLQDKLPSYMIPRNIHCMKPFPLNASNKIDRKQIKQHL